jgi:hypothetical protein
MGGAVAGATRVMQLTVPALREPCLTLAVVASTD